MDPTFGFGFNQPKNAKKIVRFNVHLNLYSDKI